MPTATATTTTAPESYRSISLKSPTAMADPASLSTLRTLYNRAARSFLNRDNSQTYALLDSAFALLHPPYTFQDDDQLAEQRKKWDILRITLETTIRSSSSGGGKIMLEPTNTLINSWYTRSLELFTPQSQNGKSAVQRDVSCLPTAVLTTLMYSSIKLDCANVGRDMAEDWLAKRSPSRNDGYSKIIELFCLQILPKLREWEYAEEFLTFEHELLLETREGFKETLRQLKLEASKPKSTTPSHKPPSNPQTPETHSLSSSASASPRSFSPAPSSSSSSLSTTSTHTVVPAAQRNGVARIARESSSASVSSVSTAKPQRPQQAKRQNKARSRTPPTFKRTVSIPNHNGTVHHHSNNVSTLALIREALSAYFASSRLSIGALLAVIIPLFSFFLHLRRRSRRGLTNSTAVDQVRKRLQQGDAAVAGNIVYRLIGEVVRIVGDTVRMGGSGLI